jgi:hypothetical protein
MQTHGKRGWLLLLCGIFEVIYCGMNFFMLRPDRTLALREFVRYRSTILDMGILALGGGVCATAAAILESRKISAWFLGSSGIALSTLGLIFMFWTGPLSFRTIALLIAAMAIGAGAYQLAIARTARWPWIAAGIVSFAFAAAFLSFAFQWIELMHDSPMATFIWMGSYFAFSAVCMFIFSARTDRKALTAL